MELMTTKFKPEHIAMDYKRGNTRIVIVTDSVASKEEQEKIRQRVSQIAYEALVKKIKDAEAG